jgi:hypothetical protein
MSLLQPTSIYTWGTEQTKDNPQYIHHVYTTDYYYSLTPYDVPRALFFFFEIKGRSTTISFKKNKK